MLPSMHIKTESPGVYTHRDTIFILAVRILIFVLSDIKFMLLPVIPGI